MSASGKSNVTDENLDKYSVELIWRRYTGHMETGKAWKDELKVVLFRQKYGVWWVCKLNTDLQGVSGLKFIDFGRYDYYTMSIDDCIKDIFSKIPLEDQYTYFGRFVRGQEYKVIVQSYPYRTYGSVLLFGYASEIVLYTEGEGVITKHETNWTLTVI